MDVDGGVEEEAPGAGTRAVDVESVRSNLNSGFALKGLAQALFSYRDFGVSGHNTLFRTVKYITLM